MPAGGACARPAHALAVRLRLWPHVAFGSHGGCMRMRFLTVRCSPGFAAQAQCPHFATALTYALLIWSSRGLTISTQCQISTVIIPLIPLISTELLALFLLLALPALALHVITLISCCIHAINLRHMRWDARACVMPTLLPVSP